MYADDAYPPYSHAVNGVASGVFPAILARFLAAMPGDQVRLQPVPWQRGRLLREQGAGYAQAPPCHRPAEWPWMRYSAPILLGSVVISCDDSVAARIAEPALQR